ncbi:tetratricopeptide repeat protein [bacterium]|nr:tetratricopeptide repeat protein [bacterium]
MERVDYVYSESELHDRLTGVYTRAAFEVRLREEIERSVRYNDCFSLLVIDLDQMRKVNATYGLVRGDTVLIEFSRRIQQNIRNSDMFFRYGGDEFVIILPYTAHQTAVKLAERLLDNISGTSFGSGPSLYLTASIGVAVFPDDGDNSRDFVKKADTCVLSAKYQGGNRVSSRRAQDVFHQIVQRDDPPRFEDLIERDKEIVIVRDFLDGLFRWQGGVLRIEGAPGSGRSCFLDAVGQLGQSRGYSVLALKATVALKSKPFSLFGLTCAQEGTALKLDAVRENVIASIRTLLQTDQTSGLMITVDNIEDCDPVTLDFFGQLMSFTENIRIALACTTVPQLISFDRFPNFQYYEHITTIPFSRDGVRTRLRQILHSEPSEEILSWMNNETKGFPALIDQGIHYLLSRHVLEITKTGWSTQKGLADISIKDKLRTQSSIPHYNLPCYWTAFIGREIELLELRQHLDQNGLVVVTGQAGIGKTRLAVHYALENLDYYQDGVYYFNLSSVRTGQQIFADFAQALDYTYQRQPDPQFQLYAYLKGKNMLFILDTFEHLQEAASFVYELVRQTSQIHIIVTTREWFASQGWGQISLSGLPYPASDESDQEAEFSAITLFQAHVRKLDRSFKPDQETKSAIISICRLVSGLPLAIELAASLVRYFPCQKIEESIRSQKNLPGPSSRDLSVQSQGLKEVYELSYGLLSEDARQLLLKLSFFPRSFTLSALREITGSDATLLYSLMDKALVQKVNGNSFQIPGGLRALVYERLIEKPSVYEEVLERFCTYYISYLGQEMKRHSGVIHKESLRRSQIEFDCIRFCWEYALERKRNKDIELIMSNLWAMYEVYGLFGEGELMFGQSLQTLFVSSRDQAQLSKQDEYLKARLMTIQAWFCYRVGHNAQSEGLIDEALTIFKRYDDLNGLVMAYNHKGLILRKSGKFAESLEAHRRSLILARELENELDIARSFNNMGDTYFGLGEYQKAREAFHESLMIRMKLGNRRGIASTYHNLANVEQATGDLIAAREYYQKSLTIKREYADTAGIASSLNNLGIVNDRLGDFESAERLFLESLAIKKEIGDQPGTATALHNLGEIAFRTGRYELSYQLLLQSYNLWKKLEDQFGLASILLSLGAVELKQNMIEAAKNHITASLTQCENIGHDWGVCAALKNLGDLAGQQGDLLLAIKHYAQALDRAYTLKAWTLVMDILLERGVLAICMEKLLLAYPVLNFVARHEAGHITVRERAHCLCAELLKKEPSLGQEFGPEIIKSLTLDDIIVRINTATL